MQELLFFPLSASYECIHQLAQPNHSELHKDFKRIKFKLSKDGEGAFLTSRLAF